MSSARKLMIRLCLCILPLPLFGCGPSRDTFAPVCPAVRLVPELADLTRYAGAGPAHDLTDMVLQARVIAVKGSCETADQPSKLAARLRVTVSLLRGPAMRGREADVPVFLAVTEGDAVLDKQIFPVHIAFPANVDRLTITSDDINLALPVSASKSGAAYGIIAGFQLTPDELAANRHAGGS